MRLCLSIALAACGLAAFGAVPASAGPIDDFRDDGSVDVCKYTPKQLLKAFNSLPPDVLQYSPGLADQLRAGQEGCVKSPSGPNPRQNIPDPADKDQDGDVDSTDAAAGGGAGGAGEGAGTPQTPAAARVPNPPTPSAQARTRLANIATPPVSAQPGSDVPGWVVLLLIALGLGALLFTLVRFGGLSTERFTAPLRASFADAGGRTADAVSEVWDSVRLGR